MLIIFNAINLVIHYFLKNKIELDNLKEESEKTQKQKLTISLVLNFFQMVYIIELNKSQILNKDPERNIINVLLQIMILELIYFCKI